MTDIKTLQILPPNQDRASIYGSRNLTEVKFLLPNGSVVAAARPIGSKEVVAANIADNTVTNSQIAAGVAKTNLDAISDTERGYVKTTPTTGQFKVIGVQRDADGKLTVSYDDTVV